METTNYVEFKKERDLGAIINDTFKFIRENWKAYFLTTFKIIYPALLFFMISLIIYLYYVGNMFSSIGSINYSEGYTTPDFVIMFIAIFFMMISLMVLYALIQASTLSYLKSYINNHGTPKYEDIRLGVKSQFWRFIGLFFIIILVFFVAGFLAILPGATMNSIGLILFSYLLLFLLFVYLWPYINIIPAVISFKDFNVSKAIDYGFKLVKGQWFPTFGVLFVVGLILSFLGFVFYIPVLIYQMIRMMVVFSENDINAMILIYRDPIYIFLTMLSYAGQLMIFSITVIASAFIFYDLNEQKNLTGTLEKIDSIGQ